MLKSIEGLARVAHYDVPGFDGPHIGIRKVRPRPESARASARVSANGESSSPSSKAAAAAPPTPPPPPPPPPPTAAQAAEGSGEALVASQNQTTSQTTSQTTRL